MLVLTTDQMRALIVTAQCCREWPVLPYARIGRCGYCNQRPRTISEASDEQPE